MAYCTATEVRYLVHTGMDDTALGNLIAIVDADIDDRNLGLDADALKRCSMLLTAMLVANRDPKSYATGIARVQYGDQIPLWGKWVDGIIARDKGYRISWWDSEDEEVKHPE